MAILKYPEGIDGSSDYIKFKFYDYKAPYSNGPIAGPASGTGYNSSANTENLQASNLPEIVITMPNDISSSISGDWGSRSFGGLTAAALGAVGGIANAGQLKTGFGNFGRRLLETAVAGGAEDILKEVTNQLSKAPGVGSSLQLNDYLGLVSGYITNPNTELLYQGTQLRNHGYTFKMIAQSDAEARDLDEIANAFKKAAAPKGNSAQFISTDIRNFIGIPNVCKVSFYQGGKTNREHPYLPRFKTSAITGVNVDYITEGQYMTYEDGRPIGITLQVNLKELKLLFSEEIGSGSDKYR